MKDPTGVEVLRYSAFTTDPARGNPAGVVLDAAGLDAAQMLALAARVGYSETAFVTGPVGSDGHFPIRYFSPLEEVTFCGHATIATAAAIAEHVAPGGYTARTPAGPVTIRAERGACGPRGSFESPPFSCEALPDGQLDVLLDCLGWSRDALHPDWIAAIGFAGNRHPVLVARDVAQLSRFDYDFNRLQRACREFAWVTVQLVAPVGDGRWRSRNPFPLGGVVEDPATGSAAAAFVGYLTACGRAAPGDSLVLEQGVEMGRASHLQVEVLAERARISGDCVALPGAAPLA